MNARYRLNPFQNALRLFTLAFTLCCSSVFAQSPNATTPETPSSQTKSFTDGAKTLRVFPLKYIDAQSTVAIISELIAEDASDSRIASDARQNTIIVSAKPAVMAKVDNLLSVLDVQGKESDNTTTVLDFMKSSGNDTPNEEFLQQAAGLWNVEVAFDRETNVLMLKGDADKVERVQEVIRSIQSQSSLQKKQAELDGSNLIRVVWLASQQSLGDPEKRLPEDLSKVASKLQNLGISDVGIACQLLARQESPEFSVSGMASFKEANVRLHVEAHPTKGQPDVLTFRITGTNPDNKQLFEMSIGARLVPNKMIVLASAPITLPSVNSTPQETQSVLVVQLLEGL